MVDYYLKINDVDYDLEKLVLTTSLVQASVPLAGVSLQTVCGSIVRNLLEKIRTDSIGRDFLEVFAGDIVIYSEYKEVARINSSYLLMIALKEFFKEEELFFKIFCNRKRKGAFYTLEISGTNIVNDFRMNYGHFIFWEENDKLLLKIDNDEDFVMLKMTFGNKIYLSGGNETAENIKAISERLKTDHIID